MEYLLKQICLICGAALLAIQVLDWYNPYMDFMGHARFVLYILCACAIGLGVQGIFSGKKEKENGGRYAGGTRHAGDTRHAGRRARKV